MTALEMEDLNPALSSEIQLNSAGQWKTTFLTCHQCCLIDLLINFALLPVIGSTYMAAG
jgi:hypothetical protein